MRTYILITFGLGLFLGNMVIWFLLLEAFVEWEWYLWEEWKKPFWFFWRILFGFGFIFGNLIWFTTEGFDKLKKML